ncbi:MAG: alpha-L-fucosidase [Pirellulales bacterium]
MNATRNWFLAAVCALAGCLAMAGSLLAAEPPKDFEHAPAADVQRWRELKFGLFIHWGPISLEGTEIGWSRRGERRGTGGTGTVPVEVYDNLYKKFNPVKFNAEEWVGIAKSAGMRYLVFTTKHHDGFSMFDSRLTDYKITSPLSPFKRDVVGELSKACHEGDLRLGYYYSPVDWHHPDYRTANHARYVQYLHGQLAELCSNYGQVDIIWFDGLGGSATDWNSKELFPLIRRLQPHAIINNRAGLAADHDTPEQEIGTFQTDRPWETCMTICHQWAWKPGDRMKSLDECIHTLVRCVGGDGNLLFNVGPMPDGRIEPRQVARLKEMGQWLQKNGESIYGTRGGPFRTAAWGASTSKGDTIYVHVLDWKQGPIQLPAIQKKIVASSILGGGSPVVKQTDESIEITVPEGQRQPLDTIVVLKLDGPAAEAKPARLKSASVAAGKKATASNVFQKLDVHGPDKAVDDDPGTRWATNAGTHEAWLEVDLGKPTLIDRAAISEAFAGRVQQFELQSQEGAAWRAFARGTTIGEHGKVQFAPVTAQKVRLAILRATEGPTIWEFQLFEPKKK